MAGRLIDISPLVDERIAVWPGDVPYERSVNLAIGNGDNIDLSSIRTTVHLGAHTDAPNHYAEGGSGIDQASLDRYYGTCQIMRVDVGFGNRVLPTHLTGPIEAERLLLHTGTYPDPTVFNEDFAALSPELVDFAADRGVLLLGIDTPSVDLCHDAALASHTAIARRGLSILEGVVLTGVADGLYTLIALPLKLRDADASPVRAVLVPQS